MKLILLTIVCSLFLSKVCAQECLIELKVGQNTRSFTLATEKPIQFTITLNDTILKSLPNGVLKINKAYFQKIKDLEVLSFDFFSQLDLEYYREPMFTRTRRILKEYCGKVLVAAPRD